MESSIVIPVVTKIKLIKLSDYNCYCVELFIQKGVPGDNFASSSYRKHCKLISGTKYMTRELKQQQWQRQRKIHLTINIWGMVASS